MVYHILVCDGYNFSIEFPELNMQIRGGHLGFYIEFMIILKLSQNISHLPKPHFRGFVHY